MLLLTRKPGQRILIGEGQKQIGITVLAMDRGQVRLGISAPRQVPVHREEVYERIQQQRQSAPQSYPLHSNEVVEG